MVSTKSTTDAQSAIKERPILFSAPMVKAILADQKTQTRRIIKPQPDTTPGMECTRLRFKNRDGSIKADVALEDPYKSWTIYCPYGIAGDRLWVRETWRPWGWREDRPITIEFKADGARMEDRSSKLDSISFGYEEWYERIVISASEECQAKKAPQDPDGNYCWSGENPLKWHPSIFMPRWASRINLEITGIRVERLNNISEEDALAEGVEPWGLTESEIADIQISDDSPEMKEFAKAMGPGRFTARAEFQMLWDHINGKDSWEANPWVWVIEFKGIAR